MRVSFRYTKYLLLALLLFALLGAAGLGVGYLILAPKLPSVEVLRDVQLQVPLRVYSRDGALMAEYGEKRRVPVGHDEVPELMRQAFIAAEDDRFYEHPGVDYQGILRAVWYLVRTGERGQGGSTITMQVARNFFLSREKTYLRKVNEILLALKIERELSKEQILELYLNKIYLGNRAYGVGAAAQIYYGRPLEELTIAEIAMIAGLPKAPSAYNPVANPTRALERRAYVLRRMRELNFISDDEYRSALEAPITAGTHELMAEVEGDYVAEWARAVAVEQLGAEEAYTGGYKIYTTVDSRRQQAATDALRHALEDYDERHGYRGPLAQVDLSELADEQARHEVMRRYRNVAGNQVALVTEVGDEQATLLVAGREEPQVLPWEGVSWAKPFVNREVVGKAPERIADVVAPGDVIYVRATEAGWRLAQIPEVQGALVALSPRDGSIVALAGGYDFHLSKFNRASQALRQPGSAFKPFVYSAALEKGFTPATVVNDAPVVFQDRALEGTWRPENYSGRFYGPTRLRDALTYSRNLVSIRVLRSIGIPYAVDYIGRFGFDADRLAHNLSLSLGNASVTPLELARGYAVLANGGFAVKPYFIERIVGPGDEVVYEANPPVICDPCDVEDALEDEGFVEVGGQEDAPEVEYAPRVIAADNAYMMTSMMRDVVQRGTGRRLQELGRGDIAGKSGTTNDQQDAWFSGFSTDLVITAWAGFDQVQPLGAGETGSRVALPMWLEFARVALEGMPERPLQQPQGLVTVRIDPETGLAARADNPDAVFEVFREETVPPLEPPRAAAGGSSGPEGSLF